MSNHTTSVPLTPDMFSITRLGEARFDTPLQFPRYVDNPNRVRYKLAANEDPSGSLSFEEAGPKRRLFFDPRSVTCGIVTCGGLCPGLNDVIRALVRNLTRYGVPKILGFQYGFEGLCRTYGHEIITLNDEVVDYIHEDGGSILGTSRGPQDIKEMVDTLERLSVNVLFTVGGDGTLRGAHEIALECLKRKLPVSVIGIPKTIDNDISFVEKTFGLDTAVSYANTVIRCAHVEATSVYNGVSVIKLMGRESGFIAVLSALASGAVNFCLVPESPFSLDGEHGLLQSLHRRLSRKHHAVIVVAEGAGGDLVPEIGKDDSGNVKRADIGEYLVGRIKSYFKENRVRAVTRYIDPSYLVRSIPANANDSAFCVLLAQHATHAAMAGCTDAVIGFWNGDFTHVPIALATSRRKKVDLNSDLWIGMLQQTGQNLS